MNLTNAELAPSSDRFAMCCDGPVARYHIWLDEKLELCQTARVVFKNPPIGTVRFSPADFKTRHLSADKGGEGKAVFDYLMARAPELLPGAIAKREERAAEEKRLNEVARRLRQIDDAAPELYAALLAGRAQLKARGIGPADEVMIQVNAAIAKAEGVE